MDISNASALVTGGAGGFGSATARRLAGAGMKVVIADVVDERGEALAKEIGGVYVRTDIMDEASIANAVKTASELAPLRAAVIVHGGPPAPGAAGPRRVVDRAGERLPLAQFAHTLNVYLTTAFSVTSQAAEAMAKNEPLASNQRGVIINTASIAGFEGQPGQAPYSAAKGGIIGMTLTIARDLAPLGIRAMAIAPGTFLTYAYLGRGATPEQIHEKWDATVPNPKRMGDPDEYGQLALQIVQNDFLNGTTIRLDGAQRF
ncbi:MAG: SDR family NAD(P)-dependent oxidoreductase [Caulobacteraceae bacterium]|nr:SDR family NAD(P)-dependent oxidoreductase [Caulobacteraceae bacterium]